MVWHRYQPIFVFGFLCATAASLHAQAVPMVYRPANTNTSSSSSSSATSTAPVDFSLMSWRFGQLSPSYTQNSVTASATTTTAQATPTPGSSNPTNNPYVAAAISMNGGISTTATTSNVTSTTSAAATATSAPVSRVVYSPRFVSLGTSTTYDYGVNNSINSAINTTNSTGGTISTNLLGITGTVAVNLVAVPEPGTLLLCGGLLALVGYGYARRKQNAVTVSAEETAPAAETITEPTIIQ